MLILWATQYSSPHEPAALLAQAIALRLRRQLPGSGSEVTTEPISGLGELPVLEISDAARQKKADALVISTEGRKGFKRLLHPSLTEALISESPCPVIVLGPRSAPVRELARRQDVLFATDFSKHADQAFRQMVRDTRLLGLNLTLFHSYEWPAEALVQAVQTGTYLFSGAAFEPHPYAWSGTVEADRHGHAWARWAGHQGVDCAWVLDDAPGRANAHLIDTARAGKCAAILLSRNSALAHWSRTRELIREAPCPVGFLPGR